MALVPIEPFANFRPDSDDDALFLSIEAFLRAYLLELKDWADRHPERAFHYVTRWNASGSGIPRHVPNTSAMPFVREEPESKLFAKYLDAAQALNKHPRCSRLMDQLVCLEGLGGGIFEPWRLLHHFAREIVHASKQYTYSRRVFSKNFRKFIASAYAERFEVFSIGISSPNLQSDLVRHARLGKGLDLYRLKTREKEWLVNSYSRFNPGDTSALRCGEFYLRYRWWSDRNIVNSKAPPAPRQKSQRSASQRQKGADLFRQFEESANAFFNGAFRIIATFDECTDYFRFVGSISLPDDVPFGAQPLFLPSRKASRCFRAADAIPKDERKRVSSEHLAYSRLARIGEKRSDQDALLDLVISAELLCKSQRGLAVASDLPVREMSNQKRIASIIVHLARLNGSKKRQMETALMDAYKLRNSIVHGDRINPRSFFLDVQEARRRVEPIVKAAAYFANS